MSTDLLEAPATIAPSQNHREVPRTGRIGQAITILIVAAPFGALLFALLALWGRGVHTRDVVLAAVLFILVGHGVTIGFHRLLAHKSFVASPSLKLALVGAGSMAFEGGPIGWVADHRRHHVFSDLEGDPHSPHGKRSPLHGLWHAHIGWLFNHEPTSWPRHAADLLADRTMVVMNALFPLWCVVSLAIPFALGWILGGNVGAALSALLWAGGVRIFFVHHVTWSINSLCHVYGRRPFVTTDRSANVGALALFTMGESWHNGHHAFPRSARHGLLPHQWDTSARAIRCFEQLGWASDVHWPTEDAIARRAAKRGPQPPR
jgi:stearoyl-CoA desaturase (delta-9 desaturase)